MPVRMDITGVLVNRIPPDEFEDFKSKMTVSAAGLDLGGRTTLSRKETEVHLRYGETCPTHCRRYTSLSPSLRDPE